FDLRQPRAAKDAHPRCAGVERPKQLLERFCALFFLETDVNGRKDPARDRQQVRCELDRIRRHTELLNDLSGVAMAKNGVGGKIIGHLDEVCARTRLLSCTAYA